MNLYLGWKRDPFNLCLIKDDLEIVIFVNIIISIYASDVVQKAITEVGFFAILSRKRKDFDENPNP